MAETLDHKTTQAGELLDAMKTYDTDCNVTNLKVFY